LFGDHDVDARRKRLLFRSAHRGMQENDLFLGRFAERHLAAMSDEQLDRFEALLEENDNDLFNWISRREALPPAFDHDVMKMILNFKISP
jgi:antitoxin CptB